MKCNELFQINCTTAIIEEVGIADFFDKVDPGFPDCFLLNSSFHSDLQKKKKKKHTHTHTHVPKTPDFFNQNISSVWISRRKLTLTPKNHYRDYLQNTPQLPYPIYSHRKAYLSKQLPWRTAGDPRQARGRSWVRAPAPARFFSPPSLPSSFFLHLPHHPCESVRVNEAIKLQTFCIQSICIFI